MDPTMWSGTTRVGISRSRHTNPHAVPLGDVTVARMGG